MTTIASIPHKRDTSLWLAAAGISLVLNLIVVVVMAYLSLNSIFYEVPPPRPKAETRAVTIQPVISEVLEDEQVQKEKEQAAFARTSESQAGPAPEDAPFIGEHDTLAKSEKEPKQGHENLPSQEGVEPRVAGQVETTESDYQDGDLAHSREGSQPAASAPPTSESDSEAVETPVSEAVAPPPPAPAERVGPDDVIEGKRTELAESPFPYELPVRPDAGENDELKATDETRDEAQDEVAEKPVEREAKQPTERANEPQQTAATPPNPQKKPKPSTESEPGFRGFQRKTQLKGSISRRGESSLDVKSGPLGKYHAALSRAIEKAWQREAVANRDYITPGVIRVRVVLDKEGKVRSVGTVDEFGIGAIQRGFTHRAIRDAELPEMPKEVKNELGGEPLELLYNFIF